MFAHSSLHGSCFVRSFQNLLLAGLRAHWRQAIGAALVLGDIAAVWMLAKGYFVPGLLTACAVFMATFLGMYDFDGLRQGIIWTAVALGLTWGFQASFRNGQLGLTLMLGLASVGVFYFLTRYARGWACRYDREHPTLNSQGIDFNDVAGSDGIEFIDTANADGIEFMDSANSDGIEFVDSHH